MNVHYEFSDAHMWAVICIAVVNIALSFVMFFFGTSKTNMRLGNPVKFWHMIVPSLIAITALVLMSSGALGVTNPERAALLANGFQVLDQPDNDEDFYYVVTPAGESAAVFVYEFQDDWYSITATEGEL